MLTTGRTGTDTLMHLLNLSDDIDAYHEPPPELLPERKRARSAVYAEKDEFKRIFVRARGASLTRTKARGKIYAETSARLTFFAPVIAELLPNARFLFVHRHPGEVVRSGVRRKWFAGHPNDYVRIEPVPGERHYEDWQRWGAFEKNCWSWDAYNRFALDFIEDSEASRITAIRSDHLFDGSSVQEIFGFLSVLAPPQDLVQSVLARKHNAQKSAHFPRYEDWTPEQRQVLEEIAGETMQRLGYAE